MPGSRAFRRGVTVDYRHAVMIPLATLLGCLLAAGSFAAARPKSAHWSMAATAILCALGALAGFAWLIAAPGSEALGLGIGPPGAAMGMALDPLSCVFLLIVFVSGAAVSAFAADPQTDSPRMVAMLPVAISAMALAVLAADAFTLLAGLGLTAVAFWAMAARDDEDARAAGLGYAGMAALAALCLIAAFALLTPAGTGFAAMRAAPPVGWRAPAVLALVLTGAVASAGLFPFRHSLPAASALMAGAGTKVALYVVVRVLFDLCGPATPAWWGLPFLLIGAAAAVLGAIRAISEEDMRAALAGGTAVHMGVIGIGAGLALLARGSDLLPLAALALGGALLHAIGHGVFKTLLFLAAGAAQHGAGTRSLGRMGGLIDAMPVTAGCALAGVAALATLPLSGGFAGVWMVLQAALAAPRIGGLALQTTIAGTLAAIGLAIGLGSLAAVRLFGIAFLGRPRTPRGAAAEEVGLWPRVAMLGLAGISVLLGLLPGAMVRLLGPVLRQTLGAGLDGPESGLVVTVGADRLGNPGPGYSALGTAIALAAIGGLLVLAARRWASRGVRRGPAWDGGFAAPPSWLPFGDPATQYGPASLAQPTLAALGRLGGPPAGGDLAKPIRTLRERAPALAGRAPLITVRGALAIMAMCLVASLIVIAAMEAP